MGERTVKHKQVGLDQNAYKILNDIRESVHTEEGRYLSFSDAVRYQQDQIDFYKSKVIRLEEEVERLREERS